MITVINLPSAFSVVRRCADGAGDLGPALEINYPLPLEPTHYTRRIRYMVDRRVYGWHVGATVRPLALNSVDPDDPNAYLVLEEPEATIGNLYFFARTYATIPKTWFEPGVVNIPLPAMSTEDVYAAGKTITSCTANAHSDIQTLGISANGYSVGDNLHISLRLRGIQLNQGNERQYAYNGFYPVKAVTTDTVSIILGPITGQFAYIEFGTARKVTAGFSKRPVTNKFLPVRIEHGYFLPGVSEGIVTADDIPLLQPFVVNRGTEDVDTWPENTLSANTVPTEAQFWAMMRDRVRVVSNCGFETYLGRMIARRTESWVVQ